jgi:hypothetical protein
MGKKSDARTALIEARLAADQEWTWQRRVIDGLTWPAIRSLALRPREAGGIGANVGIATLKGWADAHRAAQGDIVGTREERVERRQLEYETIALAARRSLARAGELETLDVHAAKVLLEVRAAEAKMHGDDKPAEIKAEIVNVHDVDRELDAMLGRIPERESQS